MRSTPLHASHNSSFGAATMWRTTPPPDGMGQDCVFLVPGSNLTRVFGCTPDSLNQTAPSLVTAMPYGREAVPPGAGNSVTLPFAGSTIPSIPRAKSV
jgi:hypothetical protein